MLLIFRDLLGFSAIESLVPHTGSGCRVLLYVAHEGSISMFVVLSSLRAKNISISHAYLGQCLLPNSWSARGGPRLLIPGLCETQATLVYSSGQTRAT